MKCISIFFCFFLLLVTSYAIAGNVTLTTYYPTPTAAYNKVNLATNYSPSTNPNLTQATAASFCTTGNSGTTYFDTGSNILSVCTGNGTSSAANGTIYTDSTGTLHVIMNNKDVVYPQECFNVFCSTTSADSLSSASNPCHCLAQPYDTTHGCHGLPQGACPSGFQQTPTDNNNHALDQLKISSSTHLYSIICCTAAPPTNASVGSFGDP